MFNAFHELPVDRLITHVSVGLPFVRWSFYSLLANQLEWLISLGKIIFSGGYNIYAIILRQTPRNPFSTKE